MSESRPQQINGTRQKVPDPETDSIENGLKQTLNNKVSPPEDDPPHCPTPDYFSDTSLTDQSIEASHIVKSSILKFEEKHKRPHPSTGVHKTVTFGQNSTKEITPLKNSYRVSSLRPCNNNNNNNNNNSSSNHHHNNNNNMGDKKGQDRVEIQSIDSLDMIEPKKVAPKPPPVYFQPPVRNNFADNKANTETKKRTTIIKITEYPTDKRREPGKFDFLNRKPETNGFDSELASTLLRSNLKNKTDAFANYSNGGTVIKIGNDRTGNGVGTGRYNGFHPMPPVIPTGITESQISSAKKSLKTFEKNTSNTVVLKIPKIN
ncbi:hypothetical protein RUM44_005013 [Polyplax serrata]|uniref:Uncharacterized protein n=1 Tax=Polyplax serrata TaxID=468196 RepID=A0ABR1AYH1_POLSC